MGGGCALKKYVLSRVGIAVLTLLAILLLLFLLMEFMPGTPFNDDKLTEAQKAIVMAKYGLDKPILVRFVTYIKNMLTGDFGLSYVISKNQPITDLLTTRLPVSLRLGGQAILLGTALGLALGLVAAIRHGTWLDPVMTVISVIGVSIPSYVFALGLSYTLGFQLKLFPMLYQAKRQFASTVLPTLSLSMFTMATVARFTRTEMLEVMNSDYLLLAETKGVSGPALIFKHALRNALLPVVTAVGPMVAGILTGSFVVEQVFAIKGIGQYFVGAISSRDYPMIMGSTVFFAALLIACNYAVDLLYGVIDPRIKLE